MCCHINFVFNFERIFDYFTLLRSYERTAWESSTRVFFLHRTEIRVVQFDIITFRIVDGIYEIAHTTYTPTFIQVVGCKIGHHTYRGTKTCFH